jgi:transposase
LVTAGVATWSPRLTPGQDADTSQLVGLVDAVRVARPSGRGRAPHAGGASDRGQGLQQPPGFDKLRYRNRNQVERLMNRRKQFRAVATRFDKLAVRYQATVCVADIFIWLRPARPNRAIAQQAGG